MEPKFGANQQKDTLYVTLKKTERLNDGPVTLMIKLKREIGFTPGLRRNRTVKVILITWKANLSGGKEIL